MDITTLQELNIKLGILWVLQKDSLEEAHELFMIQKRNF